MARTKISQTRCEPVTKITDRMQASPTMPSATANGTRRRRFITGLYDNAFEETLPLTRPSPRQAKWRDGTMSPEVDPMWIGENGAINVEAIRDEPWSIFDSALQARVRKLNLAELDALDGELFAAQMEILLAARDYYSESPRAVELQFVGREIERVPVLLDHPGQVDTASVLRSEVARVDLRWRPDAVMAAISAIGDLLPR